MIAKELLNAVLRKHALKQGKFTLASGQVSDVYLDVKQAILDCVAGPIITEAVAEAIRALPREPGCKVVAGVPDAGTALALTAARRINEQCAGRWQTLMIRKAVKEHGTQSQIEGLDNLSETPEENRCVLVEDVITTGSSTIAALRTILDCRKLTPVAVVTVVDRGDNGAQNIMAAVPLPRLEIFALTTLSAVLTADSPERFSDYVWQRYWVADG